MPVAIYHFMPVFPKVIYSTYVRAYSGGTKKVNIFSIEYITYDKKNEFEFAEMKK